MNKRTRFSINLRTVVTKTVHVILFFGTLQKYPPVPTLNRDCTKDYKIPGTDVVLEKGMPTFIPVYALHHDPKYYPEPERFDPERFNEE
jgi:cytochrome P450 family 6